MKWVVASELRDEWALPNWMRNTSKKESLPGSAHVSRGEWVDNSEPVTSCSSHRNPRQVSYYSAQTSHLP